MSGRKVNIAIASPGDVSKERDAIPTIFNRWNNTNEIAFVHPLMWESSAVPELGNHPQHQLNESIIERSDLLIAILWTRLGTPTPTASSGTIEEIREFVQRKGPKKVMLYFCTRELPNDIDPDELKKLRAFKDEINNKGIHEKYYSVQEFERLVYQHLDSKVPQFLEGKLEIPIPPMLRGARLPRPTSGYDDPNLRDVIDFGLTLDEIAKAFSQRMKTFLAIDGAAKDKYLMHGAHVYDSAAACIERFVTFAASHFPKDHKAKLNGMVARLEKLSKEHAEFLKDFPAYWKAGDAVATELREEVDVLRGLRLL